jgi:hypothetical protein
MVRSSVELAFHLLSEFLFRLLRGLLLRLKEPLQGLGAVPHAIPYSDAWNRPARNCLSPELPVADAADLRRFSGLEQ